MLIKHDFLVSLLVVLFEVNSCVPSNLPVVHNTRRPSDYAFQVSKDIITCSYYDKLKNCSDVPYLLKSSNYKYDRQFSSGLRFKKATHYVHPKVRIRLPTFSLRGRLDRPDKFYTISQPVTHIYHTNQPYIYRNIRRKNRNNFIPLKHKNHYYDTTVSLTTMKNAIEHSKNNFTLHENEILVGSTRKSASPIYIFPNFVEDRTPNDFFEQFKQSLERFDSSFYQVSFTKLRAISPENRKENAISFVQSGLLLYIALMAISTEVDLTTRLEIDSCLMYQSSVTEKIKLLKHVIAWLPVNDHNLKFRWASRLALEEGLHVSRGFIGNIANSSNLHVTQLNGEDTKDNVFSTLNSMVEIDSGGAMSDTFIEDDFSNGFCSVFISTMYIRARWRVAPTELNDTYPFKDGNRSERSVRMIKINDMMGYTELIEANAVAIEIKYASPGLTLLLLIPRGNYITNLIHYMKTTTPQEITNKMHTVRVAAILPIFTLRMTLLLPGKLQVMNISRLMDAKPGANNKCGELRLSHAVQRLMFWAEAGRNAFKDDGIEWDEAPDVKLMADRPYLFYVRWKNVTLMNEKYINWHIITLGIPIPTYFINILGRRCIR